VFPKVPEAWFARTGGTASEFVAGCIERELLVIPGSIFSRRDTHFRISYAATHETLERGLCVLRELAE
jgi:aspartate aminotransferase/aminotransferase